MAGLDITVLRNAIKAAGATWEAREPTPGQANRGLGWEPSDGVLNEVSLEAGRRFLSEKLARKLAAPAMPLPEALQVRLAEGRTAEGISVTPLRARVAAESVVSVAIGSLVRPRRFDWRDRGVIGPVTDQGWCGSCVSFATVGLIASMSAIELGIPAPDLSEADQHFNSSHGPSCGGWNNHDALEQARIRGIAREIDFPYLTAFDTPPQVTDPSDPHALWRAYTRAIADRDQKTTRITSLTAHTGNDRKTYLATVGPLVCGFTVYEDFDRYGGGVYKHVTGGVRGGHAVLVVGYDDDQRAWICRNSWGSWFGGTTARADGTGAGYFMMGYGECGVDNEPMYGCTGVLAPADPDGWAGWSVLAGGASSSGSSVYAVSRSSGKLDAFAVGTDHGTYTAAWEPGDSAWRGWWRIRGGAAAPNSSVTAVSRSTDKLDVFTVGTDQRIYTAAWESGPGGWRGWWPVAGGVAAPGTSVFGVSRSRDKLDIFAVGTDRCVYTAAWEPGAGGWRGWWRIGSLRVAPGTSVHAVSRSADKLDVFAVAEDGSICTASWEPGLASWRGWFRVRRGASLPGTDAVAVSRQAGTMDLQVVGTDRRIYTTRWPR